MLVGMTVTASAGAIGDDYMVNGVNPGWFVILIAVVIGLLAMLKILDQKKVGTGAVVVLLVGIALLVPISGPATVTPPASTKECCEFDISATALTSAIEDYITTTTWDEDSQTLTIPLTVADSSDGNLTGDQAGINITIDPMCDYAETTDVGVYTIETDYDMKYGGEYILDEDSTGYLAEITTTEGIEYYDDSIKITAENSDWVQVDYTFVNATSGSWVSELSGIGDSKTWYITISNSCGTYTETITVNAIVVSYTA